MHICNVRWQVFFPGVWVCLRDFRFFILFFAALSATLHCGKTLGPEKSFEHGKVFQEYGWETRTFEEGKKKAPLIQGGGLRQAHTIEKVENPSSRLLSRFSSLGFFSSNVSLERITAFCKKHVWWLTRITAIHYLGMKSYHILPKYTICRFFLMLFHVLWIFCLNSLHMLL